MMVASSSMAQEVVDTVGVMQRVARSNSGTERLLQLAWDKPAIMQFKRN